MSHDLDLQETIDNLHYEIADLKRRQSNFLRPVKVKSYDPKTNKAVVELADGVKTHEIPVYTHAGAARHWSPLKEGQQVTLMSPEGDINNAFLVPGGYHDGVEKPSTRDDEDVIAHDDAAIRVRKGGMVRAEVTERTKFKIKIGGQTFAIKEEALEITGDD